MDAMEDMRQSQEQPAVEISTGALSLSWSASRTDSVSRRSDTISVASTQRTHATSLYPLQARAGTDDGELEPLDEEELEPGSFDLVAPAPDSETRYSLETRSKQLFSGEHLAIIFADPSLFSHFTSFMRTCRPAAVPLLDYYLDAVKALKAIRYSNALLKALPSLEDHDFSKQPTVLAANTALQEKADRSFDALVRDELPAFITHTWIQTASLSIRKRITGKLPLHLRQMSEGLAEVFCLTDPSRDDNPIVFASEEFYRTTQYGVNYAIGRNCRFLQGPKTSRSSVERLRKNLAAGNEHCEAILNYRRDGSPFMNLLMCAPLLDSRGVTRYMIGAQVDVSGLAKDCAGLESLRRLINKQSTAADAAHHDDHHAEVGEDDAFREMISMFNGQEIEAVRRHGGSMYQPPEGIQSNNNEEGISNWQKPRLIIHNESPDAEINPQHPPPSLGIYEHYVLVRPCSNLRILFASPSLRLPGILQTPFLSRIGGSDRVRDELAQAFRDTNVVTARVRWVSKHDREGRARWIHCTPLTGSNGAVGVWMVVIVDDDELDSGGFRASRVAPPIEPHGRRVGGGVAGDMFGLDGAPVESVIRTGG
ncbi:hypothetical protein B0T19DRAFT_170270 [Cercophora scortea]|uniref:PAS domain-containing protein n=1 Tax=Cercophora scortea TaxID=314031 RepID=A0AAE0IM67_9PEZI|nr:hypothetical protein B0T19DRAFT_170270 [Cercophora scortea]